MGDIGAALREAAEIERQIAAVIDEASRDWDRMNYNGWCDEAKRGATLTSFTACRIAAWLARVKS